MVSLIDDSKLTVKPGNIAGELEKIRRMAADQDSRSDAAAGGSAAPRVKATLSNLVLLTSSAGPGGISPADRRLVDDLITDVCIQHPSRFFVVEYQGDAKADTSSYQHGILTAVSSRCVLTNSGAHVCSEEIYIGVSRQGIAAIPNLLISLFAPDVDVILLMLGDADREDDGFGSLLKAVRPVCSAVVYDSSKFADFAEGVWGTVGLRGEPGSLKLATQSDSRTSIPRPRDINYRRLRRWRELLAEGFEGDRFASASAAVERVIIRFSCGTEPKDNGRIPGEAFVIAGWIAACLGWSPGLSRSKIPGGMAVQCSLNGEDRWFEFVVDSLPNPEGAARTLTEIDLHFNPQVFAGRLSVKRPVGSSVAELAVFEDQLKPDGAASCEFFVRNAPCLDMTFESLVLKGIVAQRGDSEFDASIAGALALASAPLRPR